MKNIKSIFALTIFLLSLNFCVNDAFAVENHSPSVALIVLGNEPLDKNTPTIDMIRRVQKAVEFYKSNPDSILIFTGGMTADGISEARMMANIARAENVPENAIVLEEKARTTYDNAYFTARVIDELKPRRILIVSKADHLQWAMPIFKEIAVFKNIEALGCEVDNDESVSQMREYLKQHPENRRVQKRLNALTQGVKGVD